MGQQYLLALSGKPDFIESGAIGKAGLIYILEGGPISQVNRSQTGPPRCLHRPRVWKFI